MTQPGGGCSGLGLIRAGNNKLGGGENREGLGIPSRKKPTKKVDKSQSDHICDGS